MWFTKLTIYKFEKDFDYTAETLHDALKLKPFGECFSDQAQSSGWVPPLGDKAESFTHAANGCILLTLRTQTKTVPAATIREVLKERVAVIEQREQRKVGSKQKKQLTDEILHELLPQAFPHNTKLDAYIDTRNGWLVINTASNKAAEAFATTLRKTIGSLPVMPLASTDKPLSAGMTEWLRDWNKLPTNFFVGNECTLKSTGEDRSTATFRKSELFSNEVRAHIECGMEAEKLAMIWDNKIAFVIDKNSVITKLKFLSVLEEKMGEEDPQTHEERADIEFTLMAGEIAEMLQGLLQAMDASDTDVGEMDDEDAGLSPGRPGAVDQETAVVKTFQLPRVEMKELVEQLMLRDVLFSESHSGRVVTVIFADQEDCDQWMNHHMFVNKKLLNEYVVEEQA